MEGQGTTRGQWLVFEKYLLGALQTICVSCLALLLLLLTGNVFVRYVPVTAFYWFDEVVEWLFAWMVFLGAAVLWARNEHFKLEWVSQKLSGKSSGHIVAFFLELLSLVFLVIFFYQALRLTVLARDWTPVFNISRRWLYVCMPISGAVMVGYSVRNLIRQVMLFREKRQNDEERPGRSLSN